MLVWGYHYGHLFVRAPAPEASASAGFTVVTYNIDTTTCEVEALLHTLAASGGRSAGPAGAEALCRGRAPHRPRRALSLPTAGSRSQLYRHGTVEPVSDPSARRRSRQRMGRSPSVGRGRDRRPPHPLAQSSRHRDQPTTERSAQHARRALGLRATARGRPRTGRRARIIELHDRTRDRRPQLHRAFRAHRAAARRGASSDSWTEAGRGYGYTFPARLGVVPAPPLLRIDQILHSSELRTVAVHLLEADGDRDHRGVRATLRWR